MGKRTGAAVYNTHMRFQVPQFIDVEDKIFGPLTLKQFIYLAGTGGLVFMAFALLPRFLALLIGAVGAGLGVALAFYRVDNRPFIVVLESAFNYVTRSRLYLWRKEDRPIEPTPMSQGLTGTGKLPVPKVGEGRLKDLAFNLDVKKNLTGDDETQP